MIDSAPNSTSICRAINNEPASNEGQSSGRVILKTRPGDSGPGCAPTLQVTGRDCARWPRTGRKISGYLDRLITRIAPPRPFKAGAQGHPGEAADECRNGKRQAQDHAPQAAPRQVTALKQPGQRQADQRAGYGHAHHQQQRVAHQVKYKRPPQQSAPPRAHPACHALSADIQQRQQAQAYQQQHGQQQPDRRPFTFHGEAVQVGRQSEGIRASLHLVQAPALHQRCQGRPE